MSNLCQAPEQTQQSSGESEYSMPRSLEALDQVASDASFAREMLAEVTQRAADAGRAIDTLDVGSLLDAFEAAQTLTEQVATHESILELAMEDAWDCYADEEWGDVAFLIRMRGLGAQNRLDEDREAAAEAFAVETDLASRVEQSSTEPPESELEEILSSRASSVPPVVEIAAEASTIAVDPDALPHEAALEIQGLVGDLGPVDRAFVLAEVTPYASGPLNDALCEVTLTAEELAFREQISEVADDVLERTVGFADATATWSTANWVEYLHGTGGDVAMSWTDGQGVNILGNLLGTGAGFTAEAMMVGSLAGPVGTLVGLLVSTIAGGIATAVGSSSAEETVDGVLDAVGQATRGKILSFDAERDDAVRAAFDARAELDRQLDEDCLAGADLNVLVGFWEEEQIKTWELRDPRPSDLGLADAMLHDWVLQRAGDEEDENADTNGAAWDRQRERLFGGDLDDRRDLFIHQTRYRWNELGLDVTPLEGLAAQLDGKTGWHVKEAFDGDTFQFRDSSKREALVAYLRLHAPRDQLAESLANPDLPFPETFDLACELDLKLSDGTVFVDEWAWDLKSRPQYSFRFESSPD